VLYTVVAFRDHRIWRNFALKRLVPISARQKPIDFDGMGAFRLLVAMAKLR
jgi:hypothetical protein